MVVGGFGIASDVFGSTIPRAGPARLLPEGMMSAVPCTGLNIGSASFTPPFVFIFVVATLLLGYRGCGACATIAVELDAPPVFGIEVGAGGLGLSP